MSLEIQVGELVTETRRLHDTYEQFNQTIHSRLDTAIEALSQQVDNFSERWRRDMPVTPNLLRDTKRFTGLCDGKLNTPLDWQQGGLGGVWTGSVSKQAEGSITLEVVDMTDSERCEQLGLYPLNALENLISEQGYGTDVCAVIVDVNITQMPEYNSGLVCLGQDCYPLTSWGVGDWLSQVSVFATVLSHQGDIRAELLHNRGAKVIVDKTAVGKGWQHYHNVRQGFGGCEQSFFSGLGQMTLAIALPYEGYGYHSGVPVWAGSVGAYHANDVEKLDENL